MKNIINNVINEYLTLNYTEKITEIQKREITKAFLSGAIFSSIFTEHSFVDFTKKLNELIEELKRKEQDDYISN